MDRLAHYRAALREMVSELIEHPISYGDVRTEAIIDPSGDHYLVMHVGWQGNRRVHSCILHVDIIDEKVWIEHDGTSDGVADVLLAAGIPPESIVLGFQPPEMRRLSEFAEA
jgi:hypothetical protein